MNKAVKKMFAEIERKRAEKIKARKQLIKRLKGV